jgi:hypothetical protein
LQSRETPRVSILINNFNYARFLARSIESALAQTYAALEVVVVDDASTDGSREVMRRYEGRIRTVRLASNSGQAGAINAGFRESSGEIVMLLDADDYLYPEAARQVVDAWSPERSKIHYRLDLVDEDGGKIDLYPPPEVLLDDGDVRPLLLRRGRYETTVTSGNAFGRRALERIMPVPEADFRISADGYLVTVAPFYGTVGVIDRPLGAYRLHGGNAWALSSSGPDVLAEKLRRSLQHDSVRHAALESTARAQGAELSAGYWYRDHHHLETRLASLRLDPARHPYPADRALALALRGASAVANARISPPRRAALALWFLAMGLLPAPLARRAALWRLLHASRPAWTDRLLKAVRRAAQ